MSLHRTLLEVSWWCGGSGGHALVKGRSRSEWWFSDILLFRVSSTRGRDLSWEAGGTWPQSLSGEPICLQQACGAYRAVTSGRHSLGSPAQGLPPGLSPAEDRGSERLTALPSWESNLEIRPFFKKPLQADPGCGLDPMRLCVFFLCSVSHCIISF